MIHIPNEVYKALADELLEVIGEKSYVSRLCIPVESDDGSVLYELGISACIYRHKVSYPEGKVEQIYDVVPIWWELRTFVGDDRDEEINDAEFRRLKEYLV